MADQSGRSSPFKRAARSVIAKLRSSPDPRQRDTLSSDKSRLGLPLNPSPTLNLTSHSTTTTRPHIKVRIITWNMHDSLPTGDLTELFGDTSICNNWLPDSNNQPGELPALPYKDAHPYHLVVVGGQECPTPTTMPTGIKSALNGKNIGWTSIITRWLSTDAKTRTDAKSTTPQSSDSSGLDVDEEACPYELVAKERLMGIYISCFVWKPCKSFVIGSDSATVTAGLLNGRVGNKGAACLSVHFNSIRLLFVCAHLAAHSEKTLHRQLNVQKIKQELIIDTFTDRKRRGKSDITEVFDASFFFGDLNFRLDVTRNHADWLVKNNDYSTALKFDQLASLLAAGNTCFRGFLEAPIEFAPSYKYDVLQFKRSKPVKKSLEIDTSRLDLIHEDPESPIFETGSIRSSLTSPSNAASTSRDELCRTPSLLSPSSASTYDFESPFSYRQAAREFFGKFRSKSVSNSTPPPYIPRRRSSALSSASSPSLQSHRPTSPFTRPQLANSASDTAVNYNNTAPVAEPDAADAVFDSSAKQRVQSWCDRILYRSNMIEPARSPGSFSSLSRYRHSLFSSMSRTSTLHPAPTSSRFSAAQDRNARERSQSLSVKMSSKHLTPPQPPKLTIDSSVANTEVGRRSSPLSAPLTPEPSSNGHKRSYSLGLPHSKTTPVEGPISTGNPSFFRNIFHGLPFFSHHPSPSVVSSPEEEEITPRNNVVGPTKGEITCLTYTTANNLKVMKASTDHRPVYGVYAIGI